MHADIARFEGQAPPSLICCPLQIDAIASCQLAICVLQSALISPTLVAAACTLQIAQVQNPHSEQVKKEPDHQVHWRLYVHTQSTRRHILANMIRLSALWTSLGLVGPLG